MLAHGSDLAEASNPKAISSCPLSPYSSGPNIQIADLTFEGELKLPPADQDQISASLKEQTYSGDIDSVNSEVEERARRAWREYGYFKVQVRSSGRLLTSNPVEGRVSITLQVDEGRQYKLGRITFKNAHSFHYQPLRDLFPIQDGELFNATLFGEGLEKLREFYETYGFANVAYFPETRLSEEQGTVWAEVHVDEGKQFYISRINVLGPNREDSEKALADFLQKPGDIYNGHLVRLSMERLSVPSFAIENEKLLDERAGTVALTISFRKCPLQ